MVGDEPSPSPPPYGLLLDAFESLGDSCEFAAVQRNGGTDRLGLFKWNGVSLPILVDLLDTGLEGVDDPTRFHLKREARPNGPPEFMLWHDLFQCDAHTFVHDEMTEAEVFQREAQTLVLLRRKFLEDVRGAKRIYVYRSLAPRPETEVLRLFRALRRYGPNRLLFVKLADEQLSAGEVRVTEKGLAIGALDQMAPYDDGVRILTQLWPLLLERAHALLERQPAECGA